MLDLFDLYLKLGKKEHRTGDAFLYGNLSSMLLYGPVLYIYHVQECWTDGVLEIYHRGWLQSLWSRHCFYRICHICPFTVESMNVKKLPIPSKYI